MSKTLLELKKLSKSFYNKKSPSTRAVDDFSLDVFKGETLGLVGESGCGKSTLARLIVRLSKPDSGEIFFDGVNISNGDKNHKKLLFSKIQMIFQDHGAALNPRMRVGQILAEPLKIHNICSAGEIAGRIGELIRQIGLNSVLLNSYPHQLSGGQRQRIGIARAIAAEPQLIICDEPVSSLDVSMQFQTAALLKALQTQFNLTILFISHNLMVVKQISERVAVMYLGQLMELAGSQEIYSRPYHPYTKGLIAAIPEIKPGTDKKKIAVLEGFSGAIPAGQGCSYCFRCHKASGRCFIERPQLKAISAGHFVACHHSDIAGQGLR
ncbi:MAG: ABC transporter ATP-binding protein [Peptococcaceae bacterium]|nr:ABC transporter ATP-binding protein [Peptococcaceae bacterium]